MTAAPPGFNLDQFGPIGGGQVRGGQGGGQGGGFGESLGSILGGLGASALGGLFGGRSNPKFPFSLTSITNQNRFGVRDPSLNFAAFEAGDFKNMPPAIRKLFENAARLGISPEDAISPLSGQEDQRAAALAALDDFESGFGEKLAGARDRFFGDEGIFAQAEGIFGDARTSAEGVLSRFDQGTDSLRGRANDARAALDASTNEFITDQTQNLRGQLFGTGNLRSSELANQFANRIAPEALSGKLNALAGIENNETNILAQRAGQRGQISSSLFGGIENARINTIGQRLNTENQLTNLGFEPGRFRANVLGQPGAIFASPFTRQDAATGGGAFQPSNPLAGLATGLGSIGGSLVSQGLFGQGGFFPGPTPNAGGFTQ